MMSRVGSFVRFITETGATRPALVIAEYEDRVLALTVFGLAAEGEDVAHHYSNVQPTLGDALVPGRWIG
jgi:hypothetical protein